MPLEPVEQDELKRNTDPRAYNPEQLGRNWRAPSAVKQGTRVTWHGRDWRKPTAGLGVKGKR